MEKITARKKCLYILNPYLTLEISGMGIMLSTGDNGLEYIPSGKVFETNYLYCVFLARVTHSKYRFENNTGSKLMLIKHSLYLTKALLRQPMTVLST